MPELSLVGKHIVLDLANHALALEPDEAAYLNELRNELYAKMDERERIELFVRRGAHPRMWSLAKQKTT